MLIIETQQEYYYYSCKHEHGEELLADSLIQGSMRNDDGSDGKDDDSAAASHISINCLNINHTPTDLPTTPRNGHQPVDKDFTHLTDIGNGASVDRSLMSDLPRRQNIARTIKIQVTTDLPAADGTTTQPPTDQSEQPATKSNKQRRSKKNVEQNDSSDQLKLAQSLIGSLERKVLDLKDSNKLLKHELQLTQFTSDTNMPSTNPLYGPRIDGILQSHITTNSTNPLYGPRIDGILQCGQIGLGTSELALLKDGLNSLEYDMIRLRLHSVESPLSTSGRTILGTHQLYSH